VYIEKISLKNFRNYKEECISFDRNVNIITGKNGQGKTNLIEAVQILSLGKSFRTLIDAEMIRFGADFFHVKGAFFKQEEPLSVEIQYSKKEKRIKVDGAEKRKNADLLENVYTVVFSPEDLKIVAEDPEKRRKFLDRELFQLKPLYYTQLNLYKKALVNRNSVLKEERPDDGLLDVYDKVLSESGAKIILERAQFTEKLHEISAEIGARISGGKEDISVLYDPDIDPEASESIEAAIREKLQKSRARDKERRTTTAGPHLDDLKITTSGIDLRRYGSRGQQRTAALALKLAELRILKEETGEDAILLLDDVLSELDEERQKFLIRSFENSQLIITAAGVSGRMGKKLSGGSRYLVDSGKIVRNE
jgi:DNA replication and repair protein RecF